MQLLFLIEPTGSFSVWANLKLKNEVPSFKKEGGSSIPTRYYLLGITWTPLEKAIEALDLTRNHLRAYFSLSRFLQNRTEFRTLPLQIFHSSIERI